MSNQTIVDVVVNDSTATVVDNRDLSNLTIDLNATGQLLTNNLISSGNYLDSEIAIVSGIAQSGSNESLTGQINQLSGNLITTGQTLQTQIISNDGDISTLTSNLVTTGQTLTTNINTVSTNLGTSGQTLQTQITSNDSDINTLTTNLATTGDTLTSEINSIAGVVPTGGATNQVLAKIDSTNYNTQWVDQSGGGGSGTVTSSTATTNYLTKWTNGAGEVIGNSVAYDNGSNIGIGTTAPSSKLHVKGMISAGIAGNNSANYAALLVSSTGTGTQQSAIAIQQTYPNGNTIIWADLEPYAEYNFSHDGIDNAFTFNSGYYANSLRGITIRNRSGTQRTSYEKVKIWQNTAQVDVGGAISIGQLGTGGETQPTIRLTIKDLQDSSFNSGIALVRSTNTDTAYINMVGGNLNFNAPTGASTQFKVAGTNTFAIAANGSISSSTGASLSSGGTWTDASTRELKQDIEDLDYKESLNIIKQLTPVKFAYKKDPKNKKIGFIAEDVPDLVATEDRKGLSALQIVSALTKVVQSQQKEIQQLKRMVKRLNNIK